MNFPNGHSGLNKKNEDIQVAYLTVDREGKIGAYSLK